MSWWAIVLLLVVAFVLWVKGRSNADDVIGLLEKILAITASMVALLFAQNVFLELIVLVVALRLPHATR